MNRDAATSGAGTDVLTVGEGLVAFVAEERGRPLREVSRYSAHVVGAELNTAVGLARLGHRVAFAGRVGKDEFGRLILRRLSAEGVDTTWTTEDEAPTALLFRNLRGVPASEVVYRRASSAGARLSSHDIEPALDALPSGTFVHLSGITAGLSGMASEAASAVAQRAREGRVRLSLDLNYRSSLWSKDQAAQRLAPLVEAAQVLVATAAEATILTGAQDVETSLERLSSLGPTLVVLRHGLAGATAYQRGVATVTVEGHAIAAAIDPVGAGDAFAAGLLSGLLDELSLESALDQAHRCGAAVVGAVGDIEGALTREELAAATSADVRR